MSDCETAKLFNWSELTPAPEAAGYAGAFAGVSNDTLLLAGGANFPDNRGPWGGTRKAWHDKIWALEEFDGQWREAGRLPRALGYGVALTTPAGVLCAGGADAERHHADTFMLRYGTGTAHVEPLPPLPLPLANATGVVVGDVAYVLGGTTAPDAKVAERVFLRLDTSNPGGGWGSLPELPARGVMLATAGVLAGRVILVGGTELVVDEASGAARRAYSADAYAFNLATGLWSQLPPAPHPVVAAPSPAVEAGGELLVFGGDDGRDAAAASELGFAHPGFRDEILAYDWARGEWRTAGIIPTALGSDPIGDPESGVWAPVTAPAVEWRRHVLLVNGEIKPGVRTNRVRAAVIGKAAPNA